MAQASDAYASTKQIVGRMGDAATNLLAALDGDQQAKMVFAFDQADERTFWHYTPIDRHGLTLSEMDRRQRRLTLQLVATGLSRTGYVTASTIMGLETTLDAIEGWSGDLPGRDPERYYVRIFGTPADREPWGWSFEGHHISLNYTIVDGQIVAPTPTFFGANPAEAELSATAILRPLAGTEDLARELVHSLDAEQRARAILARVAPPDIVLTNQPYVVEGALLADEAAARRWLTAHNVGEEEAAALRYSSTPRGVAGGHLPAGQQEILRVLIGEYIQRMPDELAGVEMRKVEEAGLTGVHFAWAGGIERGQPHYYRIQSDVFLAEYDNTQNDANHIHSVWRDPHDDFGAGILARHYAHSH